MGALLPAAVATAEAHEWVDDDLFEEEERALAGAGEKRRAQFATGRACARSALASLGVAPQAIAVGRDGEALWPPGTIGSITHCDGYAAAAVAARASVATLGIDAEPSRALPRRVSARIASERELAAHAWNGVAREAQLHPETIIFSTKEAVFKAWFTLTGRKLGFAQVEVALDRARRELDARVLAAPAVLEGRPIDVLRGRWCVRDGLVCAAVMLGRGAR